MLHYVYLGFKLCSNTWILHYQPHLGAVSSHNCAMALEAATKEIKFYSCNSPEKLKHSSEIKNMMWLMKSHLKQKSYWKTNWAQKGAEETLKELNSRCCFRRGPVSPDSYTPRCSQDHVFLWETKWIIKDIKNRQVWKPGYRVTDQNLPRPRNLRKSIDSKSNSPVWNLSTAAVIFP